MLSWLGSDEEDKGKDKFSCNIDSLVLEVSLLMTGSRGEDSSSICGDGLCIAEDRVNLFGA